MRPGPASALLASLLLGPACAGPERAAPPATPAVPQVEPAPSTPARHAEPAAPAPEPVTAPAAPPPWVDAAEVESNAESYAVRWRAAPAPIPWGEPFALDVWVLEGDGTPPSGDVTLSVDAAMPEHGHGMNRVPVITRADDGSFHVEGMLFHMPGRWELYFDVTEGALTERAQLEVMLD